MKRERGKRGNKDAEFTEKITVLRRVLAGSWRASVQPLDLTAEEVGIVAPLAARAGVAGLVWRRLTEAAREWPGGDELKRSYYGQVLKNELHRRDLKQAVTALRGIGVEAVLVKGWSLEYLYPEPGLRPFGDIDLCVRKEDYGRADEFMQRSEYRHLEVDLHAGFDKFYHRRIDEVWERSRLVGLDGEEIRVPAPEDSLRFLCIHLLRHGANRALWVCDIAAAVEALPVGFDWDLCLGADRRQAGWVASTLRLTCELLGVEAENLPGAVRNANLPSWMIEVVEQEWARPFRFRLQIRRGLGGPASAWRELKYHWPNAIEATVALNADFDGRPRWPYQAGCLGVRAATYAAQSLGLMETPRARGIRENAEGAEMKTRKSRNEE